MSNVCEVCGATAAEKKSWVICPIRFGDVCMSCCWRCKYLDKRTSLFHCTFASKEKIKKEA